MKILVCICFAVSSTQLHSQAVQGKAKNNAATPIITATIDATNSRTQLEDLKQFFSDNGIKLTLKKLALNAQNEITGLHIVLEKEMERTEFSSYSNLPIPQITLGFKDNAIFIDTPTTHAHTTPNTPLSSISWPNMTMDSLLQKHRFAFHFDAEAHTEDFFGLSILEDMMKKFMPKNMDTLFHSFQHLNTSRNTQKFKFTDNPTIHKLIIINGKVSNFETLNKYATTNQLATVDVLQPETAVSIYGDKAKDGAIIATTKNN